MNGFLTYLMPDKRFVFFVFAVLLITPFNSSAQSRKKVDILHCDSLCHNEKIISNAQRLLGNVVITVDGIMMWCDSLYSYTARNSVDAFGNVHIVRGDTLNMFADYINYNGDIKLAKARRNVKLIDKTVTLTTDSLDYTMADDLAAYNYSGTVKDSTNILKSKIGQYYVNEKKALFKTDVFVETKDYNIKSDTLIYFTNTKKVYLQGPTYIFNETDTLYSEFGWYDSMKNYANLTKSSRIWNDKQSLNADSITYDKEKGEGRALGNAKIDDFENKMIVKGNYIEYNDITKIAYATNKALLIQYDEKDSLFLHADILRTIPDTSYTDAKLVLAYSKVRFYRSDLQGKCDSLSYWSKDSTIQMFTDPVIWSGDNQLTADYIEMISRRIDPDEVRLKNNAFIISMEDDSIRFNQIKGKNMIGYIRKNELYKIDVKGNGQTNYYARDADGLIGLNKAESSSISIYISDSKVKKIALITSPEGELKPIEELQNEDKILPGFIWLNDLRPISREDVFRNDGSEPEKKQGQVTPPLKELPGID